MSHCWKFTTTDESTNSILVFHIFRHLLFCHTNIICNGNFATILPPTFDFLQLIFQKSRQQSADDLSSRLSHNRKLFFGLMFVLVYASLKVDDFPWIWNLWHKLWIWWIFIWRSSHLCRKLGDLTRSSGSYWYRWLFACWHRVFYLSFNSLTYP